MKRQHKPKLPKETVEKIIKLYHDEFLEPHEIAQILDISERDVALVINPHY